MQDLRLPYVRLDGSTPVPERLATVDTCACSVCHAVAFLASMSSVVNVTNFSPPRRCYDFRNCTCVDVLESVDRWFTTPLHMLAHENSAGSTQRRTSSHSSCRPGQAARA